MTAAPDMGEVFRQLSSSDSTTRLDGARAAYNAATLEDLTRLTELRNIEQDSWVRAALDQALDRLRRSQPQLDPFSVFDEVDQGSVDSDIRDKAIEHVTKLVVHECRPLVGRIERRARSEIAGYEDSETARAVGRMRDFLKVLEKIHEAAGTASQMEFDLSDVVSGVVGEMDLRERVLVAPAEPLVVTGDPEFIRLLLPPLINNAVEASPDPGASILVTCGRSDVEAWLAVLDQGRGLPPGATNVWEPGYTTKGKTDHLGWGLAVVETTVRSMGGSVSLLPREPRGVAAEVRWPQGGRE